MGETAGVFTALIRGRTYLLSEGGEALRLVRLEKNARMEGETLYFFRLVGEVEEEEPALRAISLASLGMMERDGNFHGPLRREI